MSLYHWDFSAPTPSTLGDHDVPVVSQRLAGRRIALLVTGGIAALVYAYVARFLAIGTGSVEAGFHKIPYSLDDAARSLGTGASQRAPKPSPTNHSALALVAPSQKKPCAPAGCCAPILPTSSTVSR